MHQVPAETMVFPAPLQRHSFGPRLTARAGDIWRGMQDVVVDQSSSVGWTPERYIEAGTMFVVRTMTVRHERETTIREPLVGRTWPSRARRDMLFTRQVRLFAKAELVAAATQEWAYLSSALEPTRVGADIYAAFTIHQGFADVELPPIERLYRGPVHQFRFRTWHGWMDPFGHINHPAYIDFCDEAVARIIAAAGLDPQQVAPIAESAHFRAAIGADTEVLVETQVEGAGADHSVAFAHRIIVDEKLCATARLIRRLASEPPALTQALLPAH